MCKAFPLGRAFILTLNIVVVYTTYIYNPPKSPFEKGNLVLLSLSKEFSEISEFSEYPYPP